MPARGQRVVGSGLCIDFLGELCLLVLFEALVTPVIDFNAPFKTAV